MYFLIVDGLKNTHNLFEGKLWVFLMQQVICPACNWWILNIVVPIN
jgi:hypothetical protein